MRPLEALLAGLLTLSAISLFILPVRRYRWAHMLAPSAILLIAPHLLLEGYRWQICPPMRISRPGVDGSQKT